MHRGQRITHSRVSTIICKSDGAAGFGRAAPPQPTRAIRGEDMTHGERNDLSTRIAQATGIDPEKVHEVVRLALEELHRITIVDEKGPTAAVIPPRKD